MNKPPPTFSAIPSARLALARTLPLAIVLAGCGGSDESDEERIARTACEVVSDTGSTPVGSGATGDPAAPELASPYRTGKRAVQARSYMVVSANPLASKAGCDVLKDGGSAVDAAIAVQGVLGLVEPQSSGIGGGAFMLHYRASDRRLQTYDGRETAPAAATENHLRWIDDATQQTAPLPNARASGRSIGTPGVLRMLEVAHQQHGSKPWLGLWQPAIDLATRGFPISGRMAAAIDGARAGFARDTDAVALYLNADGSGKPLGSAFTNPAYAQTLQAIASGGTAAIYTGAIAQDIVAEINRTQGADGTALTPGKTTLADLAAYRAVERDPVCLLYRVNWVCGMGAPSSGGLAVTQTLGILENFDLASLKPSAIDLEGGKPTVQGVHLVAEAERLAYADRNKYVADTAFVPLPGSGVATLLDKGYLAQRAALIRTTASLGTAPAGNLGPTSVGTDASSGGAGTSHVSIVDRLGNVVSMTTTVESGFGAFRVVRGFVLNNELTDFSAAPSDANGPIANRVQPGKRPRSSMAPTLVFARAADGGRGDFTMATGSPGGATIIQYVVKTLVGVLDWGLDAQQAINLVNFGSSNGPTTNVGGEHPAIVLGADNTGSGDSLVSGLRALGHTVNVNAQSSGAGTILRSNIGGAPSFTGGADPRREGLVLGDTFVAAP